MAKKELPILFSTDMVLAILDGRKTQTRRIANPVHKGKGFLSEEEYSEYLKGVGHAKCNYMAGDVLYVRENLFQDNESGLTYIADNRSVDYSLYPENYCYRNEFYRGIIPNIHMPKSAARIWLEVTNVRVERLHDISEDDVKSEGVERELVDGRMRYKDYIIGDTVGLPICSFSSLWMSIYGLKNWEANPWVWVIDFKVLSTTGKPCP